MALEVTPVYRNLRTQVTLLGLEAEDLFAILAIAVVANILGRFLNREMFGLPMTHHHAVPGPAAQHSRTHALQVWETAGISAGLGEFPLETTCVFGS